VVYELHEPKLRTAEFFLIWRLEARPWFLSGVEMQVQRKRMKATEVGKPQAPSAIRMSCYFVWGQVNPKV
jgi:hypothetical protein